MGKAPTLGTACSGYPGGHSKMAPWPFWAQGCSGDPSLPSASPSLLDTQRLRTGLASVLGGALDRTGERGGQSQPVFSPGSGRSLLCWFAAGWKGTEGCRESGTLRSQGWELTASRACVGRAAGDSVNPYVSCFTLPVPRALLFLLRFSLRPCSAAHSVRAHLHGALPG